MNEGKNSLNTAILMILITAMIATSFLFWRDMNRLNNAYADIMQVEAISSTTQRQINLATNKEHLQRDVFYIGESTENALSSEGSQRISLMDNPDISHLATEVLLQWLTIEEILSVNWNLAPGETAQELNYIDLSFARDAHFKAMTDLSNGISSYTNEFKSNITQYQLMITLFAFLIAMIMLNNTLHAKAELQISKEVAQKAQIDTATGLYNRSRCQELFKENRPVSDQCNTAVMVLDLNDLKITNDSLGHRVGDELIFTFGTILKNACSVHTLAPFLGRYGGDEFLVFYEDVQDEEELKLYLKELEYLTQEHNEQEDRYQVSYAVGYCYGDKKDKMTVRQLFDNADEAMYVNKVEGKRAKELRLSQEKQSDSP